MKSCYRASFQFFLYISSQQPLLSPKINVQILHGTFRNYTVKNLVQNGTLVSTQNMFNRMGGYNQAKWVSFF